ncbi:MAG TPA: carboxypeptidase-like regulatory domain-containing protein [Terriglobales bacterium]|nr:carboxypeptidase-like regulatory domain-containing protein [Terriglobales bacterium]
MTGTVTDASGAVVPDANVTVTNVGTNVVHNAVTTSEGTFYITDLIPGTYTVKVEKSGFQTAVVKNVNVYVSQIATANAVLKTGSTSETMEVVAPSITLQTDQPNLGTVIQSTIVQEVPSFIGGGRDRQIDSFMFLAPGVTGSAFEHRINGGVSYQNEVMFNGVVIAQAETQGFQTIYNPPFDLVNEPDIITSNFSAKYGFSDGVASYRFKSGTNSLHGSAFEINRNSFFDAHGVNPPGSGEVNGVFVKGPVPHDVENNFGFSVGGPVWIPKIYNGKDKTFFFTSIDWYRVNAAATGDLTVPTQAMVGGDFSGLCTSGFTGGVCNDRSASGHVENQIYVPQNFSGGLVPSGCVAPAPGQPWAGDIIPTACFSALSKSLLPLVPAPAFSSVNNNLPPQLSVLPTRQTNGGFTIDQNLGQTQAFHFAWWRNEWNNLGCSVNCVFFDNALSGAQINPNTGTGFILTYSKTFSPHLVMTAGFSWLGEINDQYNTQTGVSFPGVVDSITLPFIRFNGNAGQLSTPSSWGMQASSGPLYGETFSINRKLGLGFDNNWLYIHGRHTFNIGFEIRRAYQDDHECQGCGGGFAFNASTTADPTNITGNTGAAFASYLLGDVDSAFRRFVDENRLRNLYMAPYIQDDIKVTPKLTVNAGLRWDIPRPFLENDDNVTFFDRTAPNAAAIDPATGEPLLGSAGKLGNCSTCAGYRRADIHWKDFSPRIGATYQLNNKTVVLGGFAINFLDQGPYEFGNNKLSVDYGSLSAGQIVVNSNGNNVPAYGIWDNNPLGAPVSAPFDPTAFNATGPLYEFSKNPGPDAYIQMWNAGVQRELPGNMLLSVSYIGNRAVHLTSMLNPINQTNPQYLSEFCPSGNPNDPSCPMSPSSPNFAWTSAVSQADLQAAGFSQAAVTCGANTNNPGLTGTYYTPYVNFLCDYGANKGLSQALLPFAQFNPSESAGGLTNQFNMAGSSLYNALQAQLQKRFSNGLTFLINYTLSRNMSNTDSGFSSFNFGALNGFDQKAEWSLSQSDQTHIANIAGVYELPLGPGKAFLNQGGIAMKNLLGGWQLSGVLTYASGTPQTIYAYNNDVFLNGFNRANYDPSVPLNVNYNNYYKGLPIFNLSAFSDPGFTMGNGPRTLGNLRNPGTANENLALAKHFYIGEKVTLEVRMEYSNFLNRVQICGFDNNVDDSNFGIVNSGQPCQNNSARQGQIYLKLSF